MSTVGFLHTGIDRQTAALGLAFAAEEHPVILLIDDQRESLSGLMDILERAGYRCASASALDAARQSVHSQPPSLVIADLNLSGASGVSLCEDLLREASLHVPVMYLSSSQIPHIIRRHHEGGSAYHLRKPIDPGVLLALITKALADYQFAAASQ